MASLTETAHQARQIIKFSIFGLVIFFVGKFALQTAWAIYLKYNPPPPPPPTVAFGKLPKVVFPTSNEEIPKLTYKLETAQLGLPTLPNVGKVYFITRYGSGFLDLERAKDQATKMGFRDLPIQVDGYNYRWATKTTPKTTLDMNINNGQFHLKYDYQNDSEIFASVHLSTTQDALNEAKSFLKADGILKDDYDKGEAQYIYYRYSPAGLVEVSSPSEGDLLKVNLFRQNLDGLRILPPDPKNSLVSFLFSGSRSPEKRMIQVDYVYYPVDAQISATYPLLPIAQAWSAVQSGKGHIANLGDNNGSEIVIRKVSLAYYDAAEPQNYLQPIYIFEGDRNFFVYYPAIDSKWVE